MLYQSEGSGLENYHSGPLVFLYFDNCSNGQAFSCHYTIAIITAHRQASTCSQVLAPGYTTSAPKQLMLDVRDHFMLRVRARLPLMKF